MNKPTINKSGEQDWLDKILAENTGYIDDGGFTERVMHRLPPRRQHRSLHAIIFACAGLLSLAALLLSAPGLTSLYTDLAAFLHAQSLFSMCALTIALSALTSTLTWWLIDSDT